MDKNIDEMYKDNVNLIHQIIRKHYPHLVNSNDYEDAFQEGSIALLKAIKEFNPELGYKFSTKNSHETYIAYKQLISQNYTIEEIAEKLDIPVVSLLSIINAYNKDYLERSIIEQDKKPITLMETVPDSTNISKDTEKKFEYKTAKILCKSFLKEEDYKLIDSYYNGKTQMELMKVFKVSQTTISRNLRKLQEVVFPYFKGYINGELTYGDLCLKLLKYNPGLKTNIKCYIDYALEMLNRDTYNKDFLIELEETLNKINFNTLSHPHSIKDIVENLKETITVIDNYCYRGGIEEVIYEMACLARNGKYKSHIDKVKEWIKNNPNRLIKIKEILKDENLHGNENCVKDIAVKELKEEGFNIVTKKCDVFNESWLSEGDTGIPEITAIKNWALNNKGKGVDVVKILTENELTKNLDYAQRYSNLARQELLEEGYSIINLQGVGYKITWGIEDSCVSNNISNVNDKNKINYSINGSMSKDKFNEIISILPDIVKLSSTNIIDISLNLKIAP